jgi:hypothetical protein
VQLHRGSIAPSGGQAHAFMQLPTSFPVLCVVPGDKTFTNHSTGTATRLGPWGYSYTPAGQVHSAEYHADTVFYIGFDGEPAFQQHIVHVLVSETRLI